MQNGPLGAHQVAPPLERLDITYRDVLLCRPQWGGLKNKNPLCKRNGTSLQSLEGSNALV